MLLDVIVPCYNEQDCVNVFFKALNKVMDNVLNFSWLVYFIDDGSTDNTLNEIKSLVSKHGSEKIKYVSFSRNFGKESAIYAGLLASQGDYIVLMDCDMQDSPSLLPEMINEILSGYDCVAAHRSNRCKEPIIRSLFANIFYRLMNKLSDVSMNPGARDFRLMTAQMRNAILTLGEYERFSKGLFAWVGFKTKWLEYPNIERTAGSTKWSFLKLVCYAISGITAFSIAPLRLMSIIGIFNIALSFVYAIYRMMRYGFNFDTSSIVILLVLFLFGVNFAFLGISGEYIARIYNETKRRPLFITKESNCKQHGLK